MKTIPWAILIGIVLLCFSCKKEPVEPVDLTGDWQSEEIYVNGKLQEGKSKTTWLLLKEDKMFQRNYVPGTWSMRSGKLELVPNDFAGLQPLQYEILSASDMNLTIEITMSEEEYFWLWGVDDQEGEQITVTEKYVKR